MTLPQDIADLQSKMSAAVREHWKAFLIEGIVLAVLGLAAMIAPLIASLAFTIFLGWMFLISGAAGLAMTSAILDDGIDEIGSQVLERFLLSARPRDLNGIHIRACA